MTSAKIFLDANIFFAAAKSPKGGSGLILSLAKRAFFKVFTTKLVLFEALRNIHKKLNERELEKHKENLRKTPFYILPKVNKDQAIEKYGNLIHYKDVPILMAAVKGKMDFFLTLDQRHFMTEKIRKLNLKLVIVTPGTFIRDYLPKLKKKSRIKTKNYE